MNNFGTIKNPLTIIAIFAGIVEVSSTTVLPFIAIDVQKVYIWFLIGFPTLLVLSFFLTLNFNNTVLYAPSDYKEDESFLKSNGRSSISNVAVTVESKESEGFRYE